MHLLLVHIRNIHQDWYGVAIAPCTIFAVEERDGEGDRRLGVRIQILSRMLVLITTVHISSIRRLNS